MSVFYQRIKRMAGSLQVFPHEETGKRRPPLPKFCLKIRRKVKERQIYKIKKLYFSKEWM
jgi:hypothetical protein